MSKLSIFLFFFLLKKDAWVKELYLERFGDQSAIKREDEQWIFVAGMLTCVGKSIQYSWDGISLKHVKGDDLGSISWNGAVLKLSRDGQDDVEFFWIQGSSEFRSKPEKNGDSSVVWSWTKDRFLQFLPLPPDDEKPCTWKFLRPVPPPIGMGVVLFSNLLAGKELVPKLVKKKMEKESVQQRSKRRNLKKSEKENKKGKVNSKEDEKITEKEEIIEKPEESADANEEKPEKEKSEDIQKGNDTKETEESTKAEVAKKAEEEEEDEEEEEEE